MNIYSSERTMSEVYPTCRTCKHRERWECGSKIISYCTARHDNRTDNGLKKVKCSYVACDHYINYNDR